uniref:ShKT domain-containing protein n=1 Tax=Steinernema glaseri TaxID=37863 RepID=A0A1I7Z4J0_9BILA
MFEKKLILAFLLATICVSTSFGDAPAAPAAKKRCAGDDGNFLPSATSCSDEISGCDTVFKTAATANSRDAQCDVDALADTALKCAKTCAICCETPAYSCTDDPAYVTLCPTWKDTCKSTVPQVHDMMAKFCPSTCGLCEQGSCRDSLPDCSKMAILCNDATAGPVWKDKCARTCNTCNTNPPGPPGPPGPSPGPGPNPAPGPGNLCADTQNCRTYVQNGFCTNTWYSEDFRRKTCGKSCGLC